jgi:hypothetical protein
MYLLFIWRSGRYDFDAGNIYYKLQGQLEGEGLKNGDFFGP